MHTESVFPINCVLITVKVRTNWICEFSHEKSAVLTILHAHQTAVLHTCIKNWNIDHI